MRKTVSIRKSDVEKLGRDLINEIDHFLHDEYIITNFPEMKLDQEKFDSNVKGEKLDIKKIYDILTRIKLDDEIDRDLYYKKESFLDLFKVLFSSYSYLEN